MKIALSILLAIAVGCSAPAAYAQTSKERIKERQEMTKMSRDQLNKKASKDARKEAKRLAKEGWQAAPGALPLEKQLDRSYLMMSEFNDDYTAKFYTAEAMSVGNSFDAAKMQALELAKQNLAGQIQTEVTALSDSKLANRQLDAGRAISDAESNSESKAFTSQSLGRIIPVVEVYRELPGGNKEVLVRIFYDSAEVRRMADDALREEMRKRRD